MGKSEKRKSLKLWCVTISKGKFDTIPHVERMLFLRFGHLTDEINSLLRLFLWSARAGPLKTEERDARVAQSLVVARVLTGKLYEAFRLIETNYSKEIRKEYDSLLDDLTRNDWSLLKKYFSDTNIINIVRNKYAFHYSHDNLDEYVNQIPPQDELVFYFSQNDRNTFFCSADAIVNNAMLEAILPGQPDEAVVCRCERVTAGEIRAIQIQPYGKKD